MVTLTGTLSRLSSFRVLIAGDLILDAYTIGKAKRISPEAPVAVLNVQREEKRPGGAGNVALNLISLGASVVILGRIGADEAGKSLIDSLRKEEVNVEGVITQAAFQTPLKNRIIADNQQIVRIDHEQTCELPPDLEAQVIASIPQMLKGVQVVAISDYGKGFLTSKLLKSLIHAAQQQQIPIIADPKGIDFSKYNGTTVIKPNLAETYAAANMPLDAPIDIAAAKVLQMADAQTLMVTRSEAGISLFHKNGERVDFPVKVREVKDVTGAGDTVLAMLTAALANGLPLEVGVQLSNIAAGIAIERFGCARITLSDIARRILEQDPNNKVFDQEHLFALKEAMRGSSYAILEVSGKNGLTHAIFKAIRDLKNKSHKDILIYVQDSEPDPEFVSLLSSLHEVNFILLCPKSLESLICALPPLDRVAV